MTNQIRTYRCASPLGDLYLTVQKGCLITISRDRTGEYTEQNNIFADQLKEYFAGTRQQFSLPLSPQGTPFQKRVWQELLTIPYGQTASYKEIAERIGRPEACRAVANAIGRNPLPIIIPCHRVIGSNGKLTGFAWGLSVKQSLLNLEGITLKE